MARWYSSFLIASLFFLAENTNAQHATTVPVQLSGRQMRAPLLLQPGSNRIELCGLTPGETYGIWANPAAAEQKANFQVSMADAAVETAARTLSGNEKPNFRRFTATDACTELLVDAASPQAGEVSMFLSVLCESCPNEWLEQFIENAPLLAPSITAGGGGGIGLITGTLIGGNCFDVTAFSSSGSSGSQGTFSNGATSIGIGNGIILCTGPVGIVAGPNNSPSAGGGFGINSADDPDLSGLAGGDQFDLSRIEFDFRPTASTVQFDFVFGSEEYCEFVNTGFNDVFGFFLNGTNIGTIGGTPITINTVNHISNSSYYVNNNNGTGCTGLPVANLPDCQLDGWTTIITATADVTPCEYQHIKLAIADVADALYSSAVFLKANSFDAGGNVQTQAIYPAGQTFVYEDCNTGFIRFTRVGGNINEAVVINYTLGPGSATSGVDYTALPNPIVIPAGQSSIQIPIDVLPDLLIEGAETIILQIENACSCSFQEATFTIEDVPPLDVLLEDQTLCGGSSALLAPSIDGGIAPFTYLWSNTAITPTINVTTPGTNTYAVTVTDACGTTSVTSAEVTLEPVPTANLAGNGFFCEGTTGTVNLTFSFTGPGPWDVVYNTASGPVSQTFTTSPTIISVTDPGAYSLVSVTSANGCTGTVTGNVNLTEYDVQASLTPNDPLCFGINNGSIQSTVSGGSPTYTYVWSPSGSGANPGSLGPGTYSVTVTDSHGCSDVQTATLEAPTQIMASATANNIDCNATSSSVSLDVSGGTPDYSFLWTGSSTAQNPTFTAGGTYFVTVTDDNGCTTTTSVTVTQNTTQPTATATFTGTINCNTTEITINGSGSSTGPNFTYQWNGPGIVSGDNTLNPVVNAGGSYTLVVTNTDNGCTRTVTVTIPENTALPTAVANAPNNIGCNAPTVAINGNGSSTGAGFTYLWSTADGNITSGINTLTPQVNQAGTYTITVTNSNNGCSSTASVTVSGNTQQPTVNIPPPGEINCYTPSLTLNADATSASGNLNYQWSASGGGSISGGGPSPTINSAGTYTVTVVDPANNCSNTATVTVQSDLVQPTAVAATPPTLTCQDETISLNANGSSTGPFFTYQWSGPGIVSGDNTLTPSISSPGTYTLTVTNTDNGCTKTITVTVPQNNSLPNAVATAPLNIGCNNPSVVLSGAGSSFGSGFTVGWTTTDGNIISGQNTLNPQINQAGTYTILVTNTANGCTNQASVTVTGNTILPTVSIDPPATINCYSPTLDLNANGNSSSGIFTFNWSASGGGTITGGNTTSAPSISSGGNYTVTITDPINNCTSTATVAVQANLTQPTATAAPPATLTCVAPEISLNANASSQGVGIEYVWTGPGIVSGENTLTPVVNAPGAYTLVVTNLTNGCNQSVTVNVNSNQNYPDVSAFGGVLNCTHPTVQILGSGPTGPTYSLSWTANPGNFVTGQTTLSPTVNEAGTYTLSITNTTNGCASDATVEITENFDVPQAVIATPLQLNCYDSEVQLDATGSTQGNVLFTWTTSNGVIVSDGDTPTPTVNDPGTYNLLLTDQVSGCTAQAQVTVTQNITQPQASAGPGGTITCLAPIYTLSGTGSIGPQYTYEWTGPSIVSGENTLTPVVDAPGVYTLLITNVENGCTRSSTVTINSNQNYPTAAVQPFGQLDCTTTLLELNGAGSSTGSGITYQWTANPGNIVTGANTIKPRVNEPGYYTLVVTNSNNGCSAEETVYVEEDVQLPTVAIDPPGFLSCYDPTLWLEASGSSSGSEFSYHWTTSNGFIIGSPYQESLQIGEPGTYQLVITNENNSCSASATIAVTEDVAYPTAVAATNGMLTCQFPQVELSGAGSSDNSPFTAQWTTTNGNIVTGANTLNPTVNQPGTYLLTITNGDNGCSSTATTTVATSQVFPTASAGPAQTLNCSTQQLTLDGNGSSTGTQFAYVWSTQNGNIVSGPNTLTPTINQPGTYTLNVLNTLTGCASTATVAIGQNITPPTAVVAPGGILSCTVSSLTLNAAGSSTGSNFLYNWTTTNGNILSGAGSLNPSVNAVGTYTLQITDQNNGCTATATTSVAADASLPVASAGAPDTLTCAVTELILDGNASSQGANISYNWSGPGITAGAATLTPTIDEPGLYELVVTNTGNGCTALSSVQIPADVALPVSDAGPAAVLNCYFPTLSLDGSASSNGPEFTYTWTTTGGHFISGENTPAPTVDQPGVYNLLITNVENGCTATDVVNISQNNTLPAAEAGPNGLITCTNATVTIAATGSTGAAFTYTWTTPNGNIASGANTLSPVVDAAGTYVLLVTDTLNGCTATDNVSVAKDANVPTALATVPGELSCAVSELQLDASTSTQGVSIQYNWTTVGGSFVGNVNTLTPIVDAPGQYTLHLLNTANNCTAVSTVTVQENLAPPLADAGVPAVISCFSPVLTLDGSGSSQGPQYSYQWTTTNGAILSGVNTLQPQVDQSGFYTIVVMDQTNGCTSDATVQILLDQNSPEADAGADQLLTCTVSALQLNGTASSVGPAFVYQWTAANGGSITTGANGLTPTIDEPGLYTLLVSNPQNGCTAVDEVSVAENQILPLVSAGTAPTLNCQLLQTPLAGNADAQGPGQLQYNWSTTDGHFISGQNGLTPSVNEPGTYTLLVTNQLTGCAASASVVVDQNVEYPVVDAGPGAVLTCLNTTNTLGGTASNVGPNFQAIWTSPNGVFVSGQNSLNPVVNAAGIYTLTVTNPDNFCSATDQVIITQDAGLPTAIAGNGPTLTCSVLSAPLDATGSSVGSQFTYNWTTLDGEIVSGATTLAPVVSQPGTYQLVVSNVQNNCQSTSSVVVAQNIVAPDAVTGAPVTLTCTDESLQVSGEGSSTGSQYAYFWTTQNGQILSDENTLYPIVGEPGEYVLQVTDQVNGCASTATATVLEDVNAPIAAAAAPGELTCQTTTLLLDGAGSSVGQNFVYQWTTSNGGQIVSGANTLSPLVSEPGNYTLQVTNNDNGCTETAALLLTENVILPSVNAGPDDELTCTDPQLTLQAIATGGADGLSYNWTASNGGTIVSGNTTTTPVIGTPGTYSLLVTDLYNGCTNTDQIQIALDQTPPTVLIATPAGLNCAVLNVDLNAAGSSVGSQFSYNWTGPGLVSGGNTLLANVNLPGTYTLSVVNTDNGCTTTLNTTVNQNIVAPLAEAGPGFELTCSVEEESLSAAGSSAGPGYTYNWTTVQGNILSGSNTAAPLVNAPGIYQLVVTNTQNACTAVDQAVVTENTNYPAALELATVLPACGDQPGTITFTEVTGGVGPYLYSVDGGENFMAASEFTDMTPGTHPLVVQDANGCEYTESLTFPVPVEPAVSTDPEIAIQFGASGTLTATLNIPMTEVESVSWSPMEGLTLTNDPRVVIVQPFSDMQYTVTIVNKDGCEASARVIVRVSDPSIWAPNVIMPGSTNANDFFSIYSKENTVDLIRTLQIYDRWGNQVFQAKDILPNDPSLGWDGTYRGQVMNPAVFVWWAEVVLVNGRSILLKGDVTIVQ